MCAMTGRPVWCASQSFLIHHRLGPAWHAILQIACQWALMLENGSDAKQGCSATPGRLPEPPVGRGSEGSSLALSAKQLAPPPWSRLSEGLSKQKQAVDPKSRRNEVLCVDPGL